MFFGHVTLLADHRECKNSLLSLDSNGNYRIIDNEQPIHSGTVFGATFDDVNRRVMKENEMVFTFDIDSESAYGNCKDVIGNICDHSSSRMTNSSGQLIEEKTKTCITRYFADTVADTDSIVKIIIPINGEGLADGDVRAYSRDHTIVYSGDYAFGNIVRDATITNNDRVIIKVSKKDVVGINPVKEVDFLGTVLAKLNMPAATATVAATAAAKSVTPAAATVPATATATATATVAVKSVTAATVQNATTVPESDVVHKLLESANREIQTHKDRAINDRDEITSLRNSVKAADQTIMTLTSQVKQLTSRLALSNETIAEHLKLAEVQDDAISEQAKIINMFTDRNEKLKQFCNMDQNTLGASGAASGAVRSSAMNDSVMVIITSLLLGLVVANIYHLFIKH